MAKNLSGLFCPKSVAVVGASRSPNKVGAIVLRNIKDSGYKGKIFPVNPSVDNIEGIKCYKSVSELPETPDLAILSIPAEASVNALNDVVTKGVKNVVLFAAGFKEIGADGQKLEDQVKEIATKNQLNILGPNCLGFINNACNINATFSSTAKLESGMKFISQSGAIASSVLDWSNSIGLGFSEFITLGNKVDINENDVLAYFKELSDSNLNDNHWSIGMYLESITQGEEFLRITSELSKRHPIFIIKPGKTPQAENAMKSHTGALAGADDVLECALEQAGVIRCKTLEDFFDLAQGFSWGLTPSGPNVAVISNAGGPGVLSADEIGLSGLKLAEFDEQTKKQLNEVLPRTASILDPVDLMGDALAERFGFASEIIIQNTSVDSILFILTPQLMTQIEKTAEYISMISNKYSKPVYCAFVGGKLIAQGEEILHKNRIPVFRFPERAIYVIATLYKYKMHMDAINKPKPQQALVELPQDTGEVRPLIQKAVNEKYHTLDNIAADSIIKSIGIITPPTKTVCDLDEAKDFAHQVGWPVVLKISANGLLHKKDLGGVITGIANDEALDDSMHKLERKIEQVSKDQLKNISIQIQKGIVGGIELIVGLKTDPNFGPVLMFGAGGSFVEMIQDKNLRLLPIDVIDAKALVEKSKIFKVLSKDYPQNQAALDKLYELIVRFSKLIRMMPEALEVEINPVIITINDVWAVDTKVVMRQSSLPAQPSAGAPTGPKFKIATVLERINVASKFNHIKLEAEEPLKFDPGQYISVRVDQTAIRSYSFATRYDDKHFDLLMDARPGGPGSLFFSNAKPGDKVQFMGPFGKFTYNPNDGADNLIFCATGSGMSATRCIIDSLLNEKKETKKINLYFGLTFPYEVFWKDHLDELTKQFNNFSYVIAVSKPDETWAGAKGFITDIIKQDFPDSSKCAAYLCGHRAMISDVCDILSANGMPSSRVYTERFV